MKPLISLGSARQLNDEDVWSLAFEFQHRILHDCFRELKGSVVRRLITANGFDLVIISSLAVLESLASMRAFINQMMFVTDLGIRPLHTCASTAASSIYGKL